MSTAALFTVAKKQKQHKYSTTENWTNKRYWIHTIEDNSATQKNVLKYSATWI